MWLVNLQKLYHCLWKLSLPFESRWAACIARFIDPFTATRDPIKGLNVYIGHMV